MKKLKNIILAVDIPLNLAGIVFCVWKIKMLLQSDLQKLVDTEGGIGYENGIILVSVVVLGLFLIFDIVSAIGRMKHKESIVGEGMIGVSFFLKIIGIIFLGLYTLL